MELFESGKVLWNRRQLVLIMLAISAVAGVLLSFRLTLVPPGLHSRVHTTGQASAQVLIDTARSQIADLNPSGSPYVYERASLLSNLMATAPVQKQIASRLKLRPGTLSVTPPAASIIAPIKATGLATDGTALAQIKPTWNLAVAIDPNLPLLDFTTTAPTPPDARSLALAAIAVLGHQVDGLAQREDVPAGARVVINTIGPPVPMAVQKGFRGIYGLAITAVMFLGLCFLLVIVDRRWSPGRKAQAGPTPWWSGEALTIDPPHRALFVRTFKAQQIMGGPVHEPKAKPVEPTPEPSGSRADPQPDQAHDPSDDAADASLAETPPA